MYFTNVLCALLFTLCNAGRPSNLNTGAVFGSDGLIIAGNPNIGVRPSILVGRVPGGQNVGTGGQNVGTGGQNVGTGGQNVGTGGQNVGTGGQNFGTGGHILTIGVSNPTTSDNVILGRDVNGRPLTGSQNLQDFAQFQHRFTFTVTTTRTIDRYVTVTDTVLNSVPVTITGFNVDTVTVNTFRAHITPVDNLVSLRTSVVERPVTEFVTTAKSNYFFVTSVSVERYTITHSAYLIHQTTHTNIISETLVVSSPVVRTQIITSTDTSTVLQTVVNTVFVHGYN